MEDDTLKTETIRFVYEKTRHHRTFHADGAWISNTPQGEIQCTFFNDLRPLPNEQVRVINPVDGVLGEEIQKPLDSHLITREANVTVVMNMAAIKALIALFSNVIQSIEQQAQEQVSKHQEDQEAPK